jgi:hypothetical protein
MERAGGRQARAGLNRLRSEDGSRRLKRAERVKNGPFENGAETESSINGSITTARWLWSKLT